MTITILALVILAAIGVSYGCNQNQKRHIAEKELKELKDNFIECIKAEINKGW